MNNARQSSPLLAALLVAFVCHGHAQTLPQNTPGSLGGTSWRLVRSQGSDDKILTPDGKGKYTIAFAADGGVSVRIDCNRGHGTWKSAGPNQLEFGPLALTRAMCPPAPINDRIVQDWMYVRSYILKDGHLFLSLMADGGTYEFEPISAEGQATGQVKGTATYRERMLLRPDAVLEATLEDVSRSDAPAEVIGQARVEHPGNPPIPFEITYDPAKIEQSHSYSVRVRIKDGDRLIFTTAQSYPVLTRGNGSEVSVLLQKTRGTTGENGVAPQPMISGLPATFAGTLPCADCSGIHYQVNLLPDRTFSTRAVYEGRNTSFDDNGSWELANYGKTLVLQGGRGAPEQFSLHDVDTLRKLDAKGDEIESKLNYDLQRVPTFVPIEPRGAETSGASLENTYWKLVQLGDTTVTSASQQREAHLVLNSETHRVNGSGGCNRLTGGYELNGDQLSFSQMASTMMACPDGMDTERAFLNALSQVKTWKLTGQQLELFDASGRLLARLEARYMK